MRPVWKERDCTPQWCVIIEQVSHVFYEEDWCPNYPDDQNQCLEVEEPMTEPKESCFHASLDPQSGFIWEAELQWLRAQCPLWLCSPWVYHCGQENKVLSVCFFFLCFGWVFVVGLLVCFCFVLIFFWFFYMQTIAFSFAITKDFKVSLSVEHYPSAQHSEWYLSVDYYNNGLFQPTCKKELRTTSHRPAPWLAYTPK